MTHSVTTTAAAVALLAMSGVSAVADSSRAGRVLKARAIPALTTTTFPWRFRPSYSPSFWGYGGRRYYDRFGNYKKYGQEPGEPGTGPVESRPLPLGFGSK